MVITLCYNFLKISLIVTENSLHFFNPNELPKGVNIYRDEDEWTIWQKRGDPIVHIDLGKWADVFVIAPLDANTLAKMSNVISLSNPHLFSWGWLSIVAGLVWQFAEQYGASLGTDQAVDFLSCHEHQDVRPPVDAHAIWHTDRVGLQDDSGGGEDAGVRG